MSASPFSTTRGLTPSQAVEQAWKPVHALVLATIILFAATQAFVKTTYYDEVAYVDPGAQLALTGKMISTAWVSNSPEALWGSSNPGLPLLFAVWFKVVGFGQAQARALVCLLHFAGVFFLFRWVRDRFAPAPWSLLLGIAASVLLPSLANTLFYPRLECLAFLLCAWFLRYAWDDGRSFFLDWLAAPILGLAAVFFGLHFVAFFVLASFGVLALNPCRRALFQGIGLVIGIGAGALVLWASFAYFGIWDTFIEARASHYGRVLPWVPLGWMRYLVNPDMPLLAILSGTGLLSAAALSGWKPTKRWVPWLSGLGIFFFLPILINIVGIYYHSYSWMVAVPMMLCFYKGEPDLAGRWKDAFVLLLLLALALISAEYVRRFPGKLNEIALRQQVMERVTFAVPKGGAIAGDFSLYYQLVGAGYRHFPLVTAANGSIQGFKLEHYSPKHLRDRIGCLVARMEAAENLKVGVGGEWRLSAEVPAGPGRPKEENYLIYVRK